jgi:tetratricopeptide (TPR) repeat protein
MTVQHDRARFLALAAVLLGVVVAYLPTFSAGWVWDDHFVLEDNPSLGQLDILLVSYVYGGGAGSDGCCNYRPLMMLSHALAQAVSTGPTSERTLSLAMHLLAVVLVIGIARGLGASWLWALFAGALLGVHSGASEAVLWPNARSDMFASSLFLAAWWAWTRERDLLAGVLLGLGPFVKESLLMVPLVAAVLLLGRRRFSWRLGVPALLGVVAYLGLREVLDMQVPFGAASTDPVGAMGAAALRGVQLALVPSSVDALPMYTSRPVLGGLVLLAGAAAVYASWGRPTLAGICAAALVLVPNAAASAQNGVLGDRYYHLILAALAVGLAVFAAGRARLPPLAWSIPLLLACLTFVRAGDWQSDEQVFGHSIAADPANPFAAFHVAHDLHVRKGDCAAAVPLYQLGMAVDGRAGNNLLACLLDLGRLEELRERGPEIARRSPDNPGPPANLARAAQRMGDLEAAERWALQATRRGRGRASHFVLLGHIASARGRPADAAAAYRRALEINPANDEARVGLGKSNGSDLR